MRTTLLLIAAMMPAAGADRQVDPTFLRRHVPDVKPVPSELTTPTCRYRPVFGIGDQDARILRGVARFGELAVEPGGSSAVASHPAEEQAWVILEGAGKVLYSDEKFGFRRRDFLYVPPGVKHGLECGPPDACRVIIMGYKIPAATQVPAPAKLQIANIDEVPKQVVGGHPPSTLYQLLMGDTRSKRDKIAAGHVLTSLFIMEFDASGTNFPHHHETEEEIYLVLDGHGDMVAGGGVDGIENRIPAKAGDAYFFRLNTTVGFYAGNKPGEPKAHVLAVRSLFPFRNR